MQYIGGHRQRLRLRLRRVEPGRRLEYELLFPYSLLGVRGSLNLRSQDGETLFRADIALGRKVPLLGWATDKFIQVFFGSYLKALRKHMAEEGENLKRVMEGGTAVG